MSKRGSLSEEDRILWSRVARSARPLKGTPPVAPAEVDGDGEIASFTAALSPDRMVDGAAVGRTVPERSRLHPFDLPTGTKLSKGRLPIEGRVDLHGMTQSEAHALLFSFLHRAYADGLRYVLVITGKGSSLGSDGVLKRAVPVWLATSPFLGMVSSHHAAARHHGGAGALYVRLRRRSGGDRP